MLAHRSISCLFNDVGPDLLAARPLLSATDFPCQPRNEHEQCHIFLSSARYYINLLYLHWYSCISFFHFHKHCATYLRFVKNPHCSHDAVISNVSDFAITCNNNGTITDGRRGHTNHCEWLHHLHHSAILERPKHDRHCTSDSNTYLRHHKQRVVKRAVTNITNTIKRRLCFQCIAKQ